MEKIEIGRLLELMAPAMIEKRKIYFSENLDEPICSLEEQRKLVEEYKHCIEFDGEKYKLSSKKDLVAEVPAYNFFLLYDTPLTGKTNEVELLLFCFQGFDRYEDLKSFIELTDFNYANFTVYVKDLAVYKAVQYKAIYDEEHDKWKKFVIPSLGEIFREKTFYNGNKENSEFLEYAVGLFTSKFDFEYYLQESRVVEAMEDGVPFETTGAFRFENKWHVYSAKFDGNVGDFHVTDMHAKTAEIVLEI